MISSTHVCAVSIPDKTAIIAAAIEDEHKCWLSVRRAWMCAGNPIVRASGRSSYLFLVLLPGGTIPAVQLTPAPRVVQAKMKEKIFEFVTVWFVQMLWGPVTAWLQTHPACCGYFIFFWLDLYHCHYLSSSHLFKIHTDRRDSITCMQPEKNCCALYVFSCWPLTVGVISSVLSPLLFQGALSPAVVDAHI